MSIVVAQSGTKLRAYEKPMLEKHFGEVTVLGAHDKDLAAKLGDIDPGWVYWRPDTERTTAGQLLAMQAVRSGPLGRDRHHINDPMCFAFTQCKDYAWSAWRKQGLPVTGYVTGTSTVLLRDFIASRSVYDYPVLMRLNNSTSGRETLYVAAREYAAVALDRLAAMYKSPRYGPGVDCKMVVQDFIETLHNGYRWSYRIIVAADTIVGAYARPAKRPNWIATMAAADWTTDMADVWLDAQVECERWTHEHAREITRAVEVLGLDFQGVDVIRDRVRDKWYLLEVQPGFAVGYLGAESQGWLPPYYNPSKPKEFVDWLQANEPTIEARCPLYWLWLRKQVMFDEAFKAIKRTKGGE